MTLTLDFTWDILICSDEGLTLEMSASESLYSGQFTLLTQLIKPNYFVSLLTPLVSASGELLVESREE